jgi:hypothetical protein
MEGQGRRRQLVGKDRRRYFREVVDFPIEFLEPRCHLPGKQNQRCILLGHGGKYSPRGKETAPGSGCSEGNCDLVKCSQCVAKTSQR